MTKVYAVTESDYDDYVVFNPLYKSEKKALAALQQKIQEVPPGEYQEHHISCLGVDNFELDEDD